MSDPTPNPNPNPSPKQWKDLAHDLKRVSQQLNRLSDDVADIQQRVQAFQGHDPQEAPPAQGSASVSPAQSAQRETPVEASGVAVSDSSFSEDSSSGSGTQPPSHDGKAVKKFPGLEMFLGVQFLSRLGMGLLFLGFILLVTYTYPKMTLEMKLGLGALTSGGLYGLGHWLVAKGQHVLGRVLQGGALGLGYLLLFGMFFIPDIQVFHHDTMGWLSLTLYSVGMLILALKLNSQSMAVMGLALGYLTGYWTHTPQIADWGASQRTPWAVHASTLTMIVLSAGLYAKRPTWGQLPWVLLLAVFPATLWVALFEWFSVFSVASYSMHLNHILVAFAGYLAMLWMSVYPKASKTRLVLGTLAMAWLLLLTPEYVVGYMETQGILVLALWRMYLRSRHCQADGTRDYPMAYQATALGLAQFMSFVWLLKVVSVEMIVPGVLMAAVASGLLAQRHRESYLQDGQTGELMIQRLWAFTSFVSLLVSWWLTMVGMFFEPTEWGRGFYESMAFVVAALYLERDVFAYRGWLSRGLVFFEALWMFIVASCCAVPDEWTTGILGLGSLVLLFYGLWQKLPLYRRSALCLLAFAIGKLLLVDMFTVDLVTKTLVSMGLGIGLMGGSYVYGRLAQKSEEASPEVPEDRVSQG